jgi:hypothetical protein
MLRVVTAVVLCGVFGLVACAGKSIGEGDDMDTPPPQLCREYANTWCSKFFNCYVKVGRLPEADKQKNITGCYDEINRRLPCADVQSVSDDFDTCLSQVSGMSCAKFDVPKAQVASIQPPASCADAMSFD